MRIGSEVAGVREDIASQTSCRNQLMQIFLPPVLYAHVHTFIRAIFLIPQFVVVNMTLPVSFRQCVYIKCFRIRYYP
jgi:hypothetical protein